ncbi:protein kinase domain-containing protein [Pantanalinema sp. GBBB05]|uniref:protein kinase domain-containing protein n=1 Tax=Pantanalinema sp. GBBB05 TaxID=2604139 RepID=UPI001D927D5D|nr:serine/threonine protein kinase [Pantanalinema sp. GBBB05]
MVSPIPLGTLLRQRYLIQEILGQGGFGRTYLALDQERFNERCVIKEFAVPYQDEALIQKSKALFQREASTLYQIQHPQIPRFSAAFEDGQRLFLVQEFVEGQTYRQLINDRKQQGQTFSETETRHFLQHMLPVLMHIHDRSIIHRDISPENIIQKATSQTESESAAASSLPVLIDFGAVKAATTHWPLISAVTRVGKVGYAPPEQLQTGKVYPNSDLYALAATTLVLLTGKEPQSLLDSQTLTWRWQPHAELSDELAAILIKMLAVYPGDRYQSAHAVWEEFQALPDLSRLEPTELQSPSLSPIDLLAIRAPSQTRPLQTHRPIQSADAAALVPDLAEASRHPVEVRPTSRLSKSRSSPRKGVKIGIVATLLMALGGLGAGLWHAWLPSTESNGEIWVSGAKLPSDQVPEIIEGPGALSKNALPNSNPEQSGGSVIAAQPQAIEFPPGNIATVLQGNLQNYNLQPYVLKASQGQILTVTLTGSNVVMNLLRSNRQGIDAAAYQTRSWTGQLPADDQYLIQVSGTGVYTLDIAITPLSRPIQDHTQRVEFSHGRNRTMVTGRIESNQIRRYLLKAKERQLMIVKVVEGKVTLSAIAPDGQQIGGTTNQLKDWKGRLTQDGDYAIEVSTTQPDDYAISFEVF